MSRSSDATPRSRNPEQARVEPRSAQGAAKERPLTNGFLLSHSIFCEVTVMRMVTVSCCCLLGMAFAGTSSAGDAEQEAAEKVKEARGQLFFVKRDPPRK